MQGVHDDDGVVDTYRRKRPRTAGQRACRRTRRRAWRPTAAAAAAARRCPAARCTFGPAASVAVHRTTLRRHMFGTTPMLTGLVAPFLDCSLGLTRGCCCRCDVRSQSLHVMRGRTIRTRVTRLAVVVNVCA